MRFLLSLLLFASAALPAAGETLTVGSKKFTESVVLGDIVTHLARATGADVRHRRELGGTRVLWEALRKGDIDLYPEYTGTIVQELLGGRSSGTAAAMREALSAEGIRMTAPLGFNNTYAIGLKRETAKRLGLSRISDLRRVPALRLGFSNEFLDRADGWPALRRRYGLAAENVRGLDHDLAYRGLAAGSIDAIDVYTTDAEIAYYDLALLEDDLGHFPAYEAVILYRSGLAGRAPAVVVALARLEGFISADSMSRLNAAAKLERIPEAKVAAEFVRTRLGIAAETAATSFGARLFKTTTDHLVLVAISLASAIVIAIPLGIAAARRERLGHAILGMVAVVQTVPSLALFVFMIPLLGIGGPPAVVALFLYSLLPIVRNTHAGITGIDPTLRESATALGLEPRARLRLVELPLASGAILAGIKTAAVINVGTATLGALIGAGGYGQPILTGIRLNDTTLILEGAVPAALLALAVQGVFELAERA
ncbi:MAG: glycine betaine ABC transporter substrate-binding protein, partial [Alphaproteobacteria bacterium]